MCPPGLAEWPQLELLLLEKRRRRGRVRHWPRAPILPRGLGAERLVVVAVAVLQLSPPWRHRSACWAWCFVCR